MWPFGKGQYINILINKQTKKIMLCRMCGEDQNCTNSSQLLKSCTSLAIAGIVSIPINVPGTLNISRAVNYL